MVALRSAPCATKDRHRVAVYLMTAKATMISFACDGCGRAFSVPANFAGRKASCKTCGTKVIVPSQVGAVAATSPAAARSEPACPELACPELVEWVEGVERASVAKRQRKAAPRARHRGGGRPPVAVQRAAAAPPEGPVAIPSKGSGAVAQARRRTLRSSPRPSRRRLLPSLFPSRRRCAPVG